MHSFLWKWQSSISWMIWKRAKPLLHVFWSIQETQCTLLDWSSHIHCGLPFGHFGFYWKNDQSPPCPPPARTRMDQGVLSRSKVDITSKFSCFLVFGRLPCFISFSGHFGFPGWDDPSACRARLWPWAQPRSCENPVGKGKTRQSC